MNLFLFNKFLLKVPYPFIWHRFTSNQLLPQPCHRLSIFSLYLSHQLIFVLQRFVQPLHNLVQLFNFWLTLAFYHLPPLLQIILSPRHLQQLTSQLLILIKMIIFHILFFIQKIYQLTFTLFQPYPQTISNHSQFSFLLSQLSHLLRTIQLRLNNLTHKIVFTVLIIFILLIYCLI